MGVCPKEHLIRLSCLRQSASGGWQLIDEANRALAGQGWSGYVAPTHLVSRENIGSNGGPNNVYDPDHGYRDVYKKMWGV